MDNFSRFLITLIVMVATIAFVGHCAQAGTLNNSWTAPTGNCDDTPLADLAGYRVRWGLGSAELPADATSHVVTGLPPGTWWVNVAAFNSEGTESQYAAAWKTISPAEFVTVTNKVYTFARANGNIILTVTSHTVPLGVVCDATQSVNGKYKVDLSAVTWKGAKLSAALADCG